MSPPLGRAIRRLAATPTVAALAVCAVACAAGAQTRDDRLSRRLRLIDPESAIAARPAPAGQNHFFDVGGTASFTALSVEDSDENTITQLQGEVSFYADWRYRSAHAAYVRSRFRYRDVSQGDSFDGRGDEWIEPFIDRAWYEFTPGAPGDRLGFSVRAGRQWVDWGAGLVYSDLMDAVRPTLRIGRRVHVEGIAGVSSREAVLDFDTSRSGFNDDTLRGYFGGLASFRFDNGARVYAFGVRMEDFNDSEDARFGVTGPVDFDYDSTYVGVGAQGSLGTRWRYEAEVVGQIGSGASDPLLGPQTREPVRALAFRAGARWLARDARQTRVEFEVLGATGDDDRALPSDTVGGNAPGTTDRAFNGLGYANTGLVFAPELTNLLAARVGASAAPWATSTRFNRLRLGADVYAFAKMNEDAPIDEPTESERFLGVEGNLYIDYRVTSDFTINARYGLFAPGGAIIEDDLRHLFLISLSLDF